MVFYHKVKLKKNNKPIKTSAFNCKNPLQSLCEDDLKDPPESTRETPHPMMPWAPQSLMGAVVDKHKPTVTTEAEPDSGWTAPSAGECPGPQSKPVVFHIFYERTGRFDLIDKERKTKNTSPECEFEEQRPDSKWTEGAGLLPFNASGSCQLTYANVTELPVKPSLTFCKRLRGQRSGLQQGSHKALFHIVVAAFSLIFIVTSSYEINQMFLKDYNNKNKDPPLNVHKHEEHPEFDSEVKKETKVDKCQLDH